MDRAAADGWTGVKLMTRIAPDDPAGAAAIELLGRVLEEARDAGLEALIEPVVWRDGTDVPRPDDVVLGAVIAHDLGAPLLKVPVPDAPGGRDVAPRRSGGWWRRWACRCSSSAARAAGRGAGESTWPGTSWPAGAPVWPSGGW